jgi:hypothetical protein
MADNVSRNTRASKIKWRETHKKIEGGKKNKKEKSGTVERNDRWRPVSPC